MNEDRLIDDKAPDSSFNTGWAKIPVLYDLKQDLQTAVDGHQSSIENIDRWLDHLHVRGQAKKKFKKGRSQVQPKLIRKHFEWRIPSLSAPFLETPELFKLTGRTYEDVYSATQNALVLNYQFTTLIDRQAFIDEYVRTFCSEGVVFFRIGWENKTRKTKVLKPVYEYATPTQEELFTLQQAMMLEQSDKGKYTALVPANVKEALMASTALGRPVFANKVGEEEIEEDVTLINQPDIQFVNYRKLYIDPNCKGDISKARYVIYEFDTNMDELQNHGFYSNLDRVLIENVDPSNLTDEQIERGVHLNYQDEARKLVTAYEYWGDIDVEGNNTTTPILVTWIGETIIRMEENPYPDKKHPFEAAQNIPVKDSVYGECDAELLQDNQAIYGAVTRAMVDIIGKTANGQKAIRMDMLDAVNEQKWLSGDDFKFNPTTDPRQGIVDIKSPEIPVSTQYMLQLQSAEAESMSGVKAYNEGLNAGAYGEVAAGIKGALDSTSKRDLQLVRRLAKGLEKVARRVMMLNSAFLSEEEVIRVTEDKYVEIRRDDLKGNIDIKVAVNTAEEEQAQAQRISFMLQTLGNTVPFGMTQILLAEVAKLGRMPDLAHKLNNYKPEPNPLAQQKEQLELALLQAQVDNEQASAHDKRMSAAVKAAEAQKKGIDIQQAMLDFVEQESGVKQEREKEVHQAQAEGNMKLEVLKAALQPKPERNKTQESGE